ncbi:MAG: DUF1207 domain-containing protein [Chlorobi bacterium]|nr:DUF1207 domain-containing protein [Chlorobiota bacterium]
MKTIVRLLVLVSVFLTVTNAYSEGGLLFKPLTANVFEARVGSFYQFDDEKLRLDIGISHDLTKFQLPDGKVISIGADFFTYTRLRSEGRMKFPVETADYYFGVNASYKGTIADQKVSARFRAAHISSHLVDGYSSGGTFIQMPFIYSREFLDLTAAIDFELFRPYAGLTYIFSTQPDDVNVFVPQIGFDWDLELAGKFSFVGGYDFKLGGYNAYTGINSGQLGILYRFTPNAGIMLNGYLYDGKSMHGMFFSEDDSYTGFGFQVYFY